MASAFESSSRNSDSETKLYSDIVCLDGVESEFNRSSLWSLTLRLCNHTLPSRGASSNKISAFSTTEAF